MTHPAYTGVKQHTMHRIYRTIVLLTVGSLTAEGQRLDGCPAPGVQSVAQGPARGSRELGLRRAGYSLTRDALVLALGDPRADVRSLAALNLAENGGQTELVPMMQAWLVEKDDCTITWMVSALSRLLRGLAWDARQHPGRQQRVTPFQACTPSQHPRVSLTIESATDAAIPGPAIRILIRNQTPQTVAFGKTASPTSLFSVTVIGPTGEPAKVIKEQEWLYKPIEPDNGNFDHRLTNAFRLVFQPVPPGEDVSWIWKVGDDFDMSVPGTYRVSFGGRVDYLDSTICSNTLSVTVEK